MNFSTILLAGGQSSRMGTDKARLTLLEQPLWQHQYQLARQLGCSDILISHPQLGTPDRMPGYGPLSGLDTLLPLCRENRVLVLAIDMPVLGSHCLHTLLRAGRSASAYYRDHMLPCVLQRTTALLQHIEEQLQPAGQHSLRQLLQVCNAVTLPCAWPQQFINTNTPAEWQMACQLVSGVHHEQA